MSDNCCFDPMSDLLVAPGERPSHVSLLNLRSLTPFQRALLATDGTVTKFIEAYTLEPVAIIRLDQKTQPLSTDHAWLDAPQGTPVVVRQVLLQGRYSDTLYAYAASLIVQDRLQETIKQGLEEDGGGLGRILLASRVESYREVLWYGKERPMELPNPISHLVGTEFISRAYRIISGGRPMMLINEKFPCEPDRLPAHH